MNEELAKIDYYLAEVKEHWNNNPDFVSGPHFYAAWEKIQKPKPFHVEGDEVVIAERRFELTDDSSEKTASFSWDRTEESAALIIEGKEWIEKIVISIEDGEPFFFKQHPVFLEQVGISYGERLEIIYDIIAYFKKNKPEIDIFHLKKKDFLQALEQVSHNYETLAVNIMKKLSKHSIERFIRKASDDMTNDDFSPQLTLPLDGTYAAHSADDTTKGDFDDQPANVNIEITIPPRTDWSVIRDLTIQREALQLSMEEEQNFVLTFNNGEVIKTEGDREVLFKITVEKEVPLQEGDMLKVYERGARKPVATFRIDLFDKNTIYGRLRFFDASYTKGPFGKLYALPRKSPLKFLKESLDAMIQSIENNTIPDLLMKLTGLIETPFTESINPNAPEEMDRSQRRAWSCAVNDNNPVTLIQGPPGTGKSKVLVDVVRKLSEKGKRILITAPSNTAVDNLCRKLKDLPLLRFGKQERSIASDVAASHWIGNDQAVMRFSDMRKKMKCGIYAGTHISLLWDEIIQADMKKNGVYDVIIFDEAGMASINEFLLLSTLAERAILFGDHKQLPPFPLSTTVKEKLLKEQGPFITETETLINGSALEWLAESRAFPVILLTRSYRCQNPRLLRFSSILFYDALVLPSETAEYFKLPYNEREKRYPQSTLKLLSTSKLPEKIKQESLIFEGTKPGIENITEALLSVYEIYRLMQKFPLQEITLIAPYKRQVKLIRSILSYKKASICSKNKLTTKLWNYFTENNISTVDSFQGGESDAVIICYVRSNKTETIGFVDDANRINVAHTRCRKEMIVIGDIECLKAYAVNEIFKRLERTIIRDGKLVELNQTTLKKIKEEIISDSTIFEKEIEPIPVQKSEINAPVKQHEKPQKIDSNHNNDTNDWDNETLSELQIDSPEDLTTEDIHIPESYPLQQPDLFDANDKSPFISG
jgi:hypothetical protein